MDSRAHLRSADAKVLGDSSGNDSVSDLWLWIATICWLLLVAAGLLLLMAYANRPGEIGEYPTQWPGGLAISRSESKPTLVLFAHPKCPCTRATLGELAWIMTRCGDDVVCRVCFVRPTGEADQWLQTDIWEMAAVIPGVKLQEDADGQLASLFGAKTSGFALLYDKDGGLLFAGGVTPSRGHRGDNLGRDEIVRLVKSDRPLEASASIDEDGNSIASLVETYVFGCPLFSTSSDPPNATLHVQGNSR